MSVRPVNFNADGSIDVVFDETGHSGTIQPDQIVWTKNMDGSDNHNYIVLNCPDGCGGTSTHPVGGGADAPSVQQLFIHKTELHGCACGHVEAGRGDALAQSHVLLSVNRMDGPFRWQVPSASGLSIQGRGVGEQGFSVVYRLSDRMIVGGEPTANVSPDHAVEEVPAAEYDKLMRFDPAYLALDNEHIQATPPQ